MCLLGQVAVTSKTRNRSLRSDPDKMREMNQHEIVTKTKSENKYTNMVHGAERVREWSVPHSLVKKAKENWEEGDRMGDKLNESTV